MACLTPGPSMWLAAKDISPDWTRYIYSDEVFWMYKPGDLRMWHHVCRFPFVPGYFLGLLMESDGITSDGYDLPETCYPVAGPFKTLKAAMAAAIVIGPIED